uniref:transcription initiation factor TFIID subunit 4-like n=1 Tax=Nyctereutes procyonoides TaxID=34880 RepID=UPI0024447E64|nr:transcription initiation factor TFIID subunit 4-like [Nyctereutes procyonoides]
MVAGAPRGPGHLQGAAPGLGAADHPLRLRSLSALQNRRSEPEPQTKEAPPPCPFPPASPEAAFGVGGAQIRGPWGLPAAEAAAAGALCGSVARRPSLRPGPPGSQSGVPGEPPSPDPAPRARTYLATRAATERSPGPAHLELSCTGHTRAHLAPGTARPSAPILEMAKRSPPLSHSRNDGMNVGCARHEKPELGESRLRPCGSRKRLTAPTRAGNGRVQGGSVRPQPGVGTRRGLLRAAARTRDEPGHQAVPRPPPARRSPGRRGKGSELAALPPPPEWFAPDILIGSSLPFERRAAGVARRPLSLGPASERPASPAQPSAALPRRPAAPAAAAALEPRSLPWPGLPPGPRHDEAPFGLPS